MTTQEMALKAAHQPTGCSLNDTEATMLSGSKCPQVGHCHKGYQIIPSQSHDLIETPMIPAWRTG